MTGPARAGWTRLLPGALWALGAVFLVWWAAHNPAADGFQNEYLHHGNALDLYAALTEPDLHTLRWIAYTGYWPWGFLAVPWPMMALLGPGRLALLLGNLLHLAALLWGAARLGRRLEAPLSPALLLLCPGVFGALGRFEPNVATVGWTAAGLACLIESQGLRSRAWALGWGACLGLGLMFDRLTVLFFLAPAVLPLLRGLDRRGWRNLGWASALCLALSGAYYREFFLRHTAELLGQASAGEIDAAGDIFVTTGALSWAYYPLALIDSQAGPALGALVALGLVALGARARRDGGLPRAEQVLLAASLPAMLLFTFIAKKQVYYTLPALAPLLVIAGQRRRLAWLGLLGGLYAFGAQGIGALPRGLPSGDWLPPRWVSHRHTLARPPSFERWPVAEAIAALEARGPVERVLVFSEVERLYEGHLVLMVRAAAPGAKIDGLLGNPHGAYELMGGEQALVLAGPPGLGWPTVARIHPQLVADHYRLSELPPVAAAVEAEGPAFELVGRWQGEGELSEPIEISAWRRISDEPAP